MTTLNHHTVPRDAPIALNYPASWGLPADNGNPACRLRVLCVDNNMDAADSLAAAVEWVGDEARSFYDGPSALEALREFRPDVCLLELRLGMEGLTLAAQIRAQLGSRPLLLAATTVLESLEDRTLTALAGFHFHLIKPITNSTLQATLNRFREVLKRPLRNVRFVELKEEMKPHSNLEWDECSPHVRISNFQPKLSPQ